MKADPRVPLRQAVAAPDSKRDYTRWVFAKIADRYDLVNVLLSFNRDQAWKRRLVARARLQPGEAALDLACGTGDIAFSLARGGAAVVGLDITPRMIELARRKASDQQAARPSSDVRGSTGSPRPERVEGRRPQSDVDTRRRTSDLRPRTSDLGLRTAVPHFLVGDMMALPFGDATFDLVTTGYGIRNVPDIGGSLREIHRVLKAGGRFFSLDFNRPANPVVLRLYVTYLAVVGSAIGWVLHGNGDTYRYIPETIRLHPGGAAVVSLMTGAGFERAAFEPVFGGFMALHSAVKSR